jgi:hypothetical protein
MFPIRVRDSLGVPDADPTLFVGFPGLPHAAPPPPSFWYRALRVIQPPRPTSLIEGSEIPVFSLVVSLAAVVTVGCRLPPSQRYRPPEGVGLAWYPLAASPCSTP